MRNNYLLLAEILKVKRILSGNSLRNVANEVGISHTELARIENGNRENFSLLTLVNLCEVLNVDVVKLLMITGYVPIDEDMIDEKTLIALNDIIEMLELDIDENIIDKSLDEDCEEDIEPEEIHLTIHIVNE